MAKRFAVLGWGSLLWDDAHPDFNAQIGPWQYDGPTLPVEFSRVSQTRGGALTLVLDPTHGASVVVAWALSRRSDLARVVEDLRLREGTTHANIGYANGREQHARFPNVAAAVTAWAAERKLDGAVWTDLASNFEEKAGRPFSISAARTHLDSLSEKGKTQARLYIRHAPAFIKTPLRAALADFVA